MNFKIAFVGAALMAFGGLFAIGCGGNDCETAADDIVAKLTSCPDYKAVETTSTSGTSVECTDALAAIATCQSACYTATSCECLGLDKSKTCDTADITKYSDCISKCK